MHNALSEFYSELINLLLWIPRKIFDLFVDGVLAVLDIIFSLCSVCNPANAGQDIAVLIADLGSPLLWLLGWFRLDIGLSIIGGSLLIRFLIRRLPVIG